jgi:hypothetical protein
MAVNQPPQPQPQPQPQPLPQPQPQPAPVETGRYHFRAVTWIWFVVAVIDIFIAGDFLLKLLAASKSSGFVNFVYQLAGILAAPFHGIWPVTTSNNSHLDPADLAAIVVYSLLAWGIVTVVRIATAPKGTKPTV